MLHTYHLAQLYIKHSWSANVILRARPGHFKCKPYKPGGEEKRTLEDMDYSDKELDDLDEDELSS